MSQLFYNFIDQVGGGWQDGLNPAQIKKIKDDVAKLGLRTDEATKKRQEMADALPSKTKVKNSLRELL
jgi:hypothetical protein